MNMDNLLFSFLLRGMMRDVMNEHENSDSSSSEEDISSFKLKIPNGDYMCFICDGIMETPTHFDCCRKNCCGKCMHRWVYNKRNNKCPHCNTEQINEPNIDSDLNEKIQKEEVVCQWCTQEFIVEKMSDHECPNICPYCGEGFAGKVEDHKNICTEYWTTCCYCSQKVVSDTLSVHYMECEKYYETCCFCNYKCKYAEVEPHKETCKEYPIRCVKCRQTHPRKKDPYHQYECPAVIIECNICGKKIRRGDIEKHVRESVIIHNNLAAEYKDEALFYKKLLREFQQTSGPEITVHIKPLSIGMITIRIKSDSTAGMLKYKYHEETGECINNLRFIYDGKQLDDDRKLEDYGIVDNCKIDLMRRLRGGKPVIYIDSDIPRDLRVSVNVKEMVLDTILPEPMVRTPTYCHWDTHVEGTNIEVEDLPYKYLFWDSQVTNNAYFEEKFTQPGWILSTRNLKEVMKVLIEKHHFTPTQALDFGSYWIPQMRECGDKVKIVFLEDIESFSELHISEILDYEHRVFVLFGPTEEAPNEYEELGWKNPEVPTGSLKVLEWGGMRIY